MNNPSITFHTFLETAFDKGNYATDDVIAFVLPLFKEVLEFHEIGKVAPFHLQDALFIIEGLLDINENFIKEPTIAPERLKYLFEGIQSNHFEITGKHKLDTEIETGQLSVEEMNVHLDTSEPLQHPAYVKGYNCFEIVTGHHDERTDIFCLGLILGSMALGLNLYDEEDLKLFASYRANPVQFNHRVHPTISGLITEMTALDRQKRLSNLYEIIHRLQHYREYNPEKQADLSKVPGWKNKALTERRQLVLNKLRNRLFDTSRRNRLLYYKPNMRFVNLTVSSVPMVLHYQSIQPNHLFTWNTDIASKMKGQKEIVLNKYLRFEDHNYLPSSLDKIRLESQRDKNEFGFSQLKLVIAFLNWHNLKENANERIQSPLLLIPVELKKIKRLKEDHYILQVLDNEAEVNPVLANQLRELYGIKLPDFIDLEDLPLHDFYKILKSQIDEANQGIQLHYSDKPKIKLVHSVARQTVSNYKRRLRHSAGAMEHYKQIAYSYDPAHYKPLGLEIFKQRIEQRPTFLEFLVNDDIQLGSKHLTDNNSKERALYQMAESEANPYSWDFDICNMVLGNFNYKKMSLVRDYNQVIDENFEHPVFDELFSNKPKELKEFTANLNDPSQWNHVITADPTQTKAVLQSRTGDSYIIQGPPGTGKSQTITNLIADFVARGKSILFVCEKRAALDVVFHRLKQNNLDELCCYIHDSQGDKRTFIKNLKTTYEDFIANKMDAHSIELKRDLLLQQIKEQIKLLEIFHNTQRSQPEILGTQVRSLIHRLVALKDNLPTLNIQQQELLPHYKSWMEFGNVIQNLSELLEQSGAEAAFATHPLSKLSDHILLAEHPINTLQASLKNANDILNNILSTVAESNIAPEHSQKIEQLKNLIQDAGLLLPLAAYNNLNLVNQNNKAAKELDKKIKQLRLLEKKIKQLQQTNSNWLNKMSEQDLVAATAIAQKSESSFFGFLNGNWRRLKNQMKQSYNFAAHQVKPSYTQVLQQLQEEYAAATAFIENKNELQQQYNVDNIDITYMAIETLRNKKDDAEIDYLLAQPHANELVKKLATLNHKIQQLEAELRQCLHQYGDKSISDIKDDMESIAMNLDGLHELLPVLKDFAALPTDVKNSLRNLELNPAQVESAMASKSLQYLYRQAKDFAAADLQALEKAVAKIKSCYRQLLKTNADLIRANIRKFFLQHIEVSNMAVGQLSAEQKMFKKNYNEGRKILENEFGKSMRYKSIRELSAKESSLVLKDIKPVWLMSPLSVSDSLPLDTSFFDVVIFDEASQITLEEGIPALFRSKQTIIVGDDKQMPPTNFFTARVEDPDDLETEESDGELLSTDADSLLIQGARKLNSTMLSWHYRSHYETLISYSNHAFYEAGLLTIPDKIIHSKEKQIIEIRDKTDAAQYANCLYDRSISFHHLPNSVYEKRSNADEAAYIAALVRSLLKKKVKDSIGIVAFSQEQQNTIEDALTTLAQQDKEFEYLLEEAYNRTEEDQFVGLIIKNLENIQGDERDIIIMSVCYGFDSRRKMIMNFGPINKKGGEKRLNVIFSRAKKHMAVISSIKHFNITNEYNEGANYFKRFLQYAESVSSGNMQTARTILDSLVPGKTHKGTMANSSLVLQQIKKQLLQHGYEATEQVGQSGFKCSLAVKANKEDEEYCLSILLDDDAHYSNSNLVEQYFQRPAILQSFGWKSMNVFAKDWLENETRVMGQILKRIKEQPEQEDESKEVIVETTVLQDSVIRKVETNDNGAAMFIEKPAAIMASNFDNIIFDQLVFVEGSSNKFWEAGLDGNKLIVRFGRVGTKGQVQIKTFEGRAAAEKEKEKLVADKIKKGYRVA